MASTSEQTDRIKERFIRCQGYWNAGIAQILDLDSEFLSLYLDMAESAHAEGGLDPLTRELVLVARDCGVTYLYSDGIRAHVRKALREGATVREIMEVFELASVLGIHSATESIPILLDESSDGMETDSQDGSLSEEQESLRSEFKQVRGYWSPIWDSLLRISPNFFRAYLNYSGAPFRPGGLSGKTKELVYTAIDVSTTHLYNPGTRIHIKNAFGLGATVTEVMQVIELVALVGFDTCAVGVPILMEELAAQESTGSPKNHYRESGKG